MGIDKKVLAISEDADRKIATGFDHAEQINDNTFRVFFVDGSSVDCVIPISKDGERGTDGTTAKYIFGIPKGEDAPTVKEKEQITLDTLIGGIEQSPYHGNSEKIVSSEYMYKLFSDILPKINTKIQSAFNLASNINYITVETYKDLLEYDVSGFDHGIHLFLVKQDEQYPRDNGADLYYSTIYIFNPVDGIPRFDLVGKLNVSEKMIETNMLRAISKALFVLDESGTHTESVYLPREEAPFKFGIDENGNYGYIKAGADSVTPFKNTQGEISITENGTFDVADFASAVVNCGGGYGTIYNLYRTITDHSSTAANTLLSISLQAGKYVVYAVGCGKDTGNMALVMKLS